MLAAVRIRGNFGMDWKTKLMLGYLGLARPNYVALLPDSMSPVLRKLEKAIAWGEVGDELKEKLSKARRWKNKDVFRLSPPKGGFKSVRRYWPKGDLGYRGKEIEKLIERMIR